MATEFKRMLVRRDTVANWGLENPILASGEIGQETDTRRIKIGDGVSNWVSLPYTADLTFATAQEVADGLDDTKVISPSTGTEYVRRTDPGTTQIVSGEVQFSVPPRSIQAPTEDTQIPNKSYVDAQFTQSAGSAGDANKAVLLEADGLLPLDAIPPGTVEYATNSEVDAGVVTNKSVTPATGAHGYLRKNAGGTQQVFTETEFRGNVLVNTAPTVNNNPVRLSDLNARFQSNSNDTGSAYAGLGVILDGDGKIDSAVVPPTQGTGQFLGGFDPETGTMSPATFNAPIDGDTDRDDADYFLVTIASGAASDFWDFATGTPSAGPASGRVLLCTAGDQVLYEKETGLWFVAALGIGGNAGVYLPLNGTQAMQGNLQMAAFNITDCNQVGGSGVVICDANSFHLDLGDLQASDAQPGRNFLAIKNSNVAGERPPSLANGEFAVNTADRTMYFGVAGTTHGVPVSHWSSDAQWKKDDVVSRLGGLYTAIADSLNVQPEEDTDQSFWVPLTGTPAVSPVSVYCDDINGDDNNGDGSVGLPFKTIRRSLNYIQTLQPLTNIFITLELLAGTYSVDALGFSFLGRWPYSQQLTIHGPDTVTNTTITGIPHADFSTDRDSPTPTARAASELYNSCGQLGVSVSDTAFDTAQDQDRTDNEALIRSLYDVVIEHGSDCIKARQGPMIGKVENVALIGTTPSARGVFFDEVNTGYLSLENVAIHGGEHGIEGKGVNCNITVPTINSPFLSVSGSDKSGIYLQNGAQLTGGKVYIQGTVEECIDQESSSTVTLSSDSDISGSRSSGIFAQDSCRTQLDDVIVTGCRGVCVYMRNQSLLKPNNLQAEGSGSNAIRIDFMSGISGSNVTIYGASLYGLSLTDGSKGTINFLTSSNNAFRGVNCIDTSGLNARFSTFANNDERDINANGGGFCEFTDTTMGNTSSPQGVVASRGAKVSIEAPGTGNVHSSTVMVPTHGTADISGAWIGT